MDALKGYNCVIIDILSDEAGNSMKKVRITVKKIARYDDLIEQYENPIEHACSMKTGQVFIANGWERPMKDPYSAMISCNDGFRPVSFLLEATEEDAG